MKKPKYILFWTWAKYRPVKTKKAGEHALKAWKLWYERKGFDVYGSVSGGQIIAIRGEQKHAICLRDAIPTQKR